MLVADNSMLSADNIVLSFDNIALSADILNTIESVDNNQNFLRTL
jgi:hypothetical protein